MNDRLKFLLLGAGIGITGAVAGGIVVAWALSKGGIDSQSSAVGGQPSASINQKSLKISPTVLPAVGGTNARFVVSRGTNVVAAGGKPGTGKQNGRLATSSPTGNTSNPAYQKVQNEPEVIKAREELVAAQKRAADVMEKAMKETSGGISFEAFHKIQNVPEVKTAREAAAEAQRRYFEVMKKAAEGLKTETK